MSETAEVASALGLRLEKVSGTVDLEWLALTPREKSSWASPSLLAKHAVMILAGLRRFTGMR